MCHVVPMIAGAATTLIWKKNHSPKVWNLSLMLYGGWLFGLIDHIWNGELFFISKYWVKDLTLGVVITATIFLAWGILLWSAKKNITVAIKK